MEDKVMAIRAWLGVSSINIFGMPYAGKDTQGQVLADLLHAELMGGGQIFRNSIIPPHVQKIMEAGGLAPTEDFIRIVLPYMSSEKFSKKPLLLSAVGRWDGEQEGVLQAAEASGHSLRVVLLLEVAEEVARERHRTQDASERGNRADDAPEVFDTRLAEFRNKTLPVIEFYENKGLLIRVDGSLHPPAVTEQIIETLYELASA